MATLAELATVVGRGITPRYADNGAMIVVNQRCIRDGRVDLGPSRRHDSNSRPVVTEKLLSTGDILVNSTGVGTLGRTAPVKSFNASATVDSHVTIVRPNLTTESAWLAYALSLAEGEIESMAEGSTGQTELSRHRLALLPLEVPPLDEQRAIAATLGALDDKIESNRRAIALMENLTRAEFNRRFDVGFDDLGVALSTLIAVNPPRKLSRGESSIYVGMSSLPEFSAEIYEWESKPVGSGAHFVNGDVLVARITPCLENGKTAVIDMLKPDEVAWGSTEYIILAPRSEFRTAWIYCLARNDEVRSFAIRSMSGTSGRQRFKADRFDQYKIRPPSSAALREFNAIAEPLFNRMEQLRDESLCLLALRDALLPELLSGRIRVPEAHEAVQEVVV